MAVINRISQGIELKPVKNTGLNSNSTEDKHNRKAG